MGCDIHVVAEVRRNGAWQAITDPIFDGDEYDRLHGRPQLSEPFGWRGYAMFTLFADVRSYGNDVIPISEPRGLPGDASDHTRNELDWHDLHSHSWLSLNELDIDAQTRELVGLGDQFEAHRLTLASLGAPEDVRIVFAFDN